MREPVERQICGRTFSVAPLPAMRALKLWPLVAKAFHSGGEPLVDLNGDEVERLTRELLSMARVDGKELMKVFDLELQGDISTVMALLGFAFEVNYASGFSVAAPEGQGAAERSAA